MKLEQHSLFSTSCTRYEHSFEESLKRSHEAEDLPVWECLYRACFTNFLSMHNHRGDGDHQRVGIDRSIILANGKHFFIDEKIRGRNQKTGEIYTDICLEYWSDVGRKVPGWVVKPLMVDYIAYAIAPLGKAWLLPVPALQAAWLRNSCDWIAKFPMVNAPNNSNGRRYITRCCAVPADTVMKAVGAALRFSFTAFELQ